MVHYNRIQIYSRMHATSQDSATPHTKQAKAHEEGREPDGWTELIEKDLKTSRVKTRRKYNWKIKKTLQELAMNREPWKGMKI